MPMCSSRNPTVSVVITIGRLSIGGAERRLLQVIAACRATGAPVEFTLFVVSGVRGVLDDDFRAAGAGIVYGRPGIPGLLALWSLCRRSRPDILHVNAETAAGFYACAGLIAGVSDRLAHFHTMEAAAGVLGRAKSVGYQLTTNLFCQRIIGVCEGSRRQRIILRPWRTIYNGVEAPTDDVLAALPAPPRYDDSRPRVTVLCRIDRPKNVERAIRVFRAFRERGPAELHVVGPFVTVPQAELLDLALALGIASDVHFHGPVMSPLEYLAHSSVVLLTSRIEGLPGVVLESLACGTPVVASEVPGVLEIAARVPGVSCLSLDRDDAIWAATIHSALATPRKEIREQFRTSPFTLDRYLTEMLEVWRVIV